MIKKVLLTLAVAAGILAMASHGSAALVYNYNTVFSGTGPGGSTPWLTAVFDDSGGSGSVTLTLSTSGLVGNAFVGEWDFNTKINPSTLSITQTSGPTPYSISTGLDKFKADGDGYYDIEFIFSQAQAPTFGANQTAVFTITGVGITEETFYALSAKGSGQNSGPFYTAAHIQGYGNSAWVTVPIPAAAWLLGSGLLGLVVIRRRMKK